MRLFISAGEPSGDLHGTNLIHSLRQHRPDIDFLGFGGERMEAASCRLVYPLAQLAMVGIGRILANVPRFAGILHQADCSFRKDRPDAVVLIDYPGFHWWLARRAHAHNIPVLYFVPPQIWAWASWRIGKMREFVDEVLCTLAFEEPWYQKHGVPVRYIGHPYFDELRQQKLDEDYLAAQRAQAGTLIGLLPGSRTQELEWNVPSLIRAAQRIHQQRPETRFLFACLKPAHQRYVEGHLQGVSLPVAVQAGKTAEIIHLAHSCLSVSGSVSLELLHHGRPSVICYHGKLLYMLIARCLKNCRFITLVNMLADKELYPEYVSARCQAEAMAGHVITWLEQPAVYHALRQELANLRQRVAIPGACERAARAILDFVQRRAGQNRLAA